MADLIAIGYDDTVTAHQAAEEAERLAKDLIIKPDAIAVITRNADGKYKVTTNHHIVGSGASWGMFWGFLFGLLFFVPVLGLAVGAGMGAIMGKITKSGVDKEFEFAGPRPAPARHLGAVPGRREGHARQGRRRPLEVRRARAEDLALLREQRSCRTRSTARRRPVA